MAWRGRRDVVVTGTPIDLRRILSIEVPVRLATYEPREIGSPTLVEVLTPLIERTRRRGS